MKRWVFVVLVAALVLALASLLWAQQQSATAQAQTGGTVCPPGTVPAGQAAAGGVTQNSEVQRCSTTCNTVMPYYRQKYGTLRTHEGAAQCWDNCWSRFGSASQANVSVSDKKQLWQQRNAQYLRANQCAQTCYRTYHDQQQQAAITVAGFRSEPRPWVSAGTAPGSPVAGMQPIGGAQGMTAPAPATAEPGTSASASTAGGAAY